jgi:hypothetical protein
LYPTAPRFDAPQDIEAVVQTVQISAFPEFSNGRACGDPRVGKTMAGGEFREHVNP